ncbi:MAG TPA: HlyD family efflux transporter periplasmic adaptor subunit [Stellaceae bacterium]
MKARAEIIDDELLGLGSLVQLGKRVRSAASVEELGFIVVNETHALVPYRQAALWRRDAKGAGGILALSGAPAIEHDAPFALWLERVLAAIDGNDAGAPARVVGAADLPKELGEEWADWLPPRGLWLPIPGRDGAPLGALLLAREPPWQDSEGRLLVELADIYGHAWAALRGGRRRSWRTLLLRDRRKQAAIAAVLFALLWLPVTQSALAPAEVVPLEPAVVRAPIDGVIDQVVVQPNQDVKADQLLLTLDPATVQNRLEVARKALEVAEAESRQAAQQSLFDDKSRSQLAALQGRLEQRRAEVAYVASLLDRLSVKADRPGIAVFDDRNDWTGRPVTIGERILTIANPDHAELEIRLSVPDAITLEPGAPVAFFLNVAPERSISAVLRYASYEATLSPDGVLSYRLKASFGDGQAAPRIGLKGTAKIYGQRVSLFYFLMRRPLAALRQLVGF